MPEDAEPSDPEEASEPDQSEDETETVADDGATDNTVLRLGGIVVVFVACFLVGFGVIYMLIAGVPAVDVFDAPEQNTTEETALSQENVSAKAEEYLIAQLPPFVRNATTVSMEKDTSIEGTEYMWAWSVELYVEPNSFGQWATNETTTRTESFYLSKNGEYIFFSEPESTDVQQGSGPTGPLG
ncbi:MAG: hypothetical protein MUP66_01985 [Candidatus Nanohaloarchaeota archaeon QJJ-5]|nr:hypothetical protein [Candidatus Nanohaloarchaeota archaeon QJJ-5]